FPDWSQFRSNWTVTGGIQVPLFTGGSIHGDELVAEANLRESQARQRQTRQLAALDTRDAVSQLEAAQAQFAASEGTVDQAVKAYQIAEVRYREGISPQTELSDSRISLQQAQANRAQAARDLQVARVRFALLHDLPISTTGAPGAPTMTNTLQQPAPSLTVPPVMTVTPAQPAGFVGQRVGRRSVCSSRLPARVAARVHRRRRQRRRRWKLGARTSRSRPWNNCRAGRRFRGRSKRGRWRRCAPRLRARCCRRTWIAGNPLGGASCWRASTTRLSGKRRCPRSPARARPSSRSTMRSATSSGPPRWRRQARSRSAIWRPRRASSPPPLPRTTTRRRVSRRRSKRWTKPSFGRRSTAR